MANMKEAQREVLIPYADILERVAALAKEIKEYFLTFQSFKDLEQKEIVMLIVLKGAGTFAVELGRCLADEGIEALHEHVRVTSYGRSLETNGTPQVVGEFPGEALRGKHVLIVEDILDTGLTLEYLQKLVAQYEIVAMATVVLLAKPEESRQASPVVQFKGFEIDNVWVEGSGLDSAGIGRNNRDVVTVSFPKPEKAE